jgi:uncharacterized RDD family membrane protein YckC
VEPQPGAAATQPEAVSDHAPAGEPARPWREELSERVESFRRRRARLRHGFDSRANLDLDFDTEGDFEGSSALESRLSEFPRTEVVVDAELETPSSGEGAAPILEAMPLEKPGGGLRVLSSAAVQAGELPLESGAPEPEPVEIFVEPAAAAQDREPTSLVLPLASLGRRFLAGLADAAVLLLGAGLLAAIFWRAGGHLSPLPLNLAVLGLIAVFFILVYFGLFTALTSTTPGLLWMELEVRNLDGLPPTGQEAFWRAFGYLVSISALMLGFVWALVDSDGLTWHDRMSGTFIVPIGQESPAEYSTLEV